MCNHQWIIKHSPHDTAWVKSNQHTRSHGTSDKMTALGCLFNKNVRTQIGQVSVALLTMHWVLNKKSKLVEICFKKGKIN